MILRTLTRFEQMLADNCQRENLRFACGKLSHTVSKTTRRGSGSVRISSQNHTPSFDGQQASPSATLPVLFCQKPVPDTGRKSTCPSDVVGIENSKKGRQLWGLQESHWQFSPQRASRHAAIRYPNKQSAVRPSGQGLPSSPAAVRCKVLQSAQARLSSRVRPNCSVADNLNNRRIAPHFSDAPLASGMPAGVFCVSTPLSPHKRA